MKQGNGKVFTNTLFSIECDVSKIRVVDFNEVYTLAMFYTMWD